MKKILSSLVAMAILGSSAYAITIDEASVKAHFTGFKLEKKLGVNGVIDGATFKFAKNEGSVVEILEGVIATMDFANENTNDKIREKNIHRTYIANLEDSKIEASLKDVKGDDNEGTATGVITFNKITKEIPMTYKVSDGKLVVKGEINMRTDFNTEKSFIALSTDKQISALHGKKTHEEVEIYFDVDVK
ncbi:YceI family protein [Campylobacter sp. MG1]|uniref:YceI family protein n=1 Tax=Campylobacter sp. MG1 TaxID=2976332 RepID=UPI00226CC903|nr:YceI family protein [Campylobacter sp. MG1]